MRFQILTFLAGTVLTAVLTMNGVGFARNTSKHDCVSFAEASKHVGTTQCVSGTVLHVDDGSNGLTFLNFCKDAKACPFTVIVLPDDLRKVGDIRQLEGRQIEIKGTIEDHDGRAGITLRHTQQLGEAAFLVIQVEYRPSGVRVHLEINAADRLVGAAKVSCDSKCLVNVTRH